jgi:hypothetical protein
MWARARRRAHAHIELETYDPARRRPECRRRAHFQDPNRFSESLVDPIDPLLGAGT